jgi:glycerol-3-phosphate dehydrogenase
MTTDSRLSGKPPHYDIFIIGGGINGAGIARDAAGRGFSVCLCEAADFAGGTSSASTKLIHGGLRYLEHFEFRLVREALIEREILLSLAPHIIRPLRFVLPHHKGLRPAWILRLGLFLYDHIGGRKLLPGTKTLDLCRDEAGKPLKPDYMKAFEYSDCWVEDSRLVILNLRDAHARGADIRSRTRVVKAIHDRDVWCIDLEDTLTGARFQASAASIVNATGPWVDTVLKTVFGRNNVHNVRLVRGSHIVINRKFAHDKCYMFQNSDGRVIFAIPYEQDYTLIGTTDIEQPGDMAIPEITRTEIAYLCETASAYFEEPVRESDIVWTYSGVRPLFDDGATKAQEATRDYVIRQDEPSGDGVLFNIFGGKITTYRKLSEAMLERIEQALGARGEAWTRDASLPGGDFLPDGFDALNTEMAARYPFIELKVLSRLVRHYGTDTANLLGKASNESDLGRYFGAGLYEIELRYLVKNEWVQEAEDALFRRTRLGFRLDDEQIEAVCEFLRTLADRP